MFYLKALLLLSLFFNAVLLAAPTNTGDWLVVKEEQGISVYTRRLAYSDYKEFKVKTTLTASLNELLDFINNASACPDWQYRCLKMLNLSDHYLYKLSDLPWPLSNRYTVMLTKGTFNSANNTYTLTLKNIKRTQLPIHIISQLPEEKDTIQMRHSDGYWQFKHLPLGKIQITHQMHGDPAGSLPAVLANQGVINAAFITVQNLKKHFHVD